MNLKEVKVMAKDLGISPKSLKKAELIQAIQQAENNPVCFGSAAGTCEQKECLWFKDCVK